MKDIEKRIQEAFSDFERVPPPHCWERIQCALQEEKALLRSNRSLLLLKLRARRYLVAATFLLLGGIVSLLFWNRDRYDRSQLPIGMNLLDSSLIQPLTIVAPAPPENGNEVQPNRGSLASKQPLPNVLAANSEASALNVQVPETYDVTFISTRKLSLLADTQEKYPLPRPIISEPEGGSPSFLSRLLDRPLFMTQNPLITIEIQENRIRQTTIHLRNKEIIFALGK